MGKATNPARERRKRANDNLKAKGQVERVNGVDINHGGSPVTRWRAKGMLNAPQEAAIAYCHRIWSLVGVEQRTTAAYSERVPAAINTGESGRLLLARMEAGDDLARIKDYVPRPYWEVFENCVRFDEPAGVAGGSLGFGSRASKERAHTIVCFVADMITMKERLSY